jgi:6-phosphogluconolactonase
MHTPGTYSQKVRWHRVEGADALTASVVARTLAAAQKAIRERGRFSIVLAGGATPRAAYERLREAPARWSAWHVFFGDERCAPRDDPQRNSRMADEAWLAHAPIPRGQVHEIPAEWGPLEGAARYSRVLDGVDSFDLVLLGLGEDGHTASLFPGNECGQAPNSPDVLPVFNAPKPPSERISLSAHRLSRAEEVLFMVGAGKDAALRRWLAREPIPARMIAPRRGVDVFMANVAGDLDR